MSMTFRYKMAFSEKTLKNVIVGTFCNVALTYEKIVVRDKSNFSVNIYFSFFII